MKLEDFSQVFFEAQADAETQSESSLLNKLPAEMRNRIYELAFSTSTVVIGLDRNENNSEGKPQAPGLLLSSKQAYFEAIKLYWSKSTFHFLLIGEYVDTRSWNWLMYIGRRRLELLSDVTIELSNNNNQVLSHPLQHQVELRLCAKRALHMLRNQKPDRIGIPKGALKFGLLLPDSVGGRKLKKVWTSTPRETAIQFLSWSTRWRRSTQVKLDGEFSR